MAPARRLAAAPHPEPPPPLPSPQGGGGGDVAPWSSAVAAVSLLAVDPQGLGGLRLRASADPARDRLLAIARGLFPAGAPWRTMPAAIGDQRLLGGLDLAATLGAGRPVMARGLLAEVEGGALVASSAERMTSGLAGRIALALDAGGFALLALDEAAPDDEPPPAALTERLGLVASLAGATRADLAAPAPDPAAIVAARARLPSVRIDDAALEALADAAMRLGVFGVRPLIFAAAAARAAAALAGRATVGDADLALAARLVIGPRATMLPAPSERPDDAPEPEPDPQPEPETDDPAASSAGEEETAAGDELAERVLEAAAATLPVNLLSGAAEPTRSPSRAPGRAGAAHASKRRGRPIGARPGGPENGARLDLVETLRAAAPWQGVRRGLRPSPSPLVGESLGEGAAPDDPNSAAAPSSDLVAAAVPHEGRVVGILVRREDFRIQRLKERRRTLTVFAVDASGSAALNRLAEAKGAVELLLAQAYVRRDEVALIAFRGRQAEVLLPPTRSLARARRALSALPGGGGTPLASGLDLAATLCDAARRRGDQPTLVLLTDGQANVARDGSGGRGKAQDEALAAAGALKALALACVLIDVSPRPQPRARELAAAMAARYAPLPMADAGAIVRAVRAN